MSKTLRVTIYKKITEQRLGLAILDRNRDAEAHGLTEKDWFDAANGLISDLVKNARADKDIKAIRKWENAQKVLETAYDRFKG
tara:strand:- start:504 stop:752 length:249 start_codon:yes stop_codon:yes gene_type:complete